MTTAGPYLIITLFLLIFVVANIGIYRLIIKTAEKRIKQNLEELGLKYERIRRTGFLNVGNFREDDIIELTANYENGRISSTHYKYLDFKDSAGQLRTVTVRIRWHLFTKTRLDFRPDLKKYAA